MISAHVLVAVLITSCASKMNNRKMTAPIDAVRVYQGVEDITSKYAYVVSIQSIPVEHETIKGISIPRRICTGSLISESWVLTAAHCCSKKAELIQYGNMSVPVSKTQFKSDVLKRIKHPHSLPPIESVGTIEANDIGLLLVRPVWIAKYGNVSALDYTTLLGSAVEYAGYGLTFLPEKKPKDVLLKFKLGLSAPLQIGEAVVIKCEHTGVIGFNCIAPKCSLTQAVVNGDSGGPMIYDHKIVALVCGGIKVRDEKIERFFTPVSSHVTWIHKVINSRRNEIIKTRY